MSRKFYGLVLVVLVFGFFSYSSETFALPLRVHHRPLTNDTEDKASGFDLTLSGSTYFDPNGSGLVLSPGSYLISADTVPFYKPVTYSYWQDPAGFCAYADGTSNYGGLRHAKVSGGPGSSSYLGRHFISLSPFITRYWAPTASETVRDYFPGSINYANCIALYGAYDEIMVTATYTSNSMQIYVNNFLADNLGITSTLIFTGSELIFPSRTSLSSTELGNTFIQTGTIRDISIFYDYFTGGQVDELYSLGPTPPEVTDFDGLCGYALGFTGSFDPDEACIFGTYTGLVIYDISGYTGYSYYCLGSGTGQDQLCETAEQTTGFCGTMQSRTFYQDINDYSTQYTFCSGGNNLMTGLQYIEGNYWDWYCNGITELGPQAYCSAYDFNQDVPLCGNAHSNTYSTGSFAAFGTGEMLCSQGDVNFLQFREDFGRLWECNVENSINQGVECVSYLSGGLGFITPTYTGENPFQFYEYILTGTDLVSYEANYLIALMKDYVPFFDDFWTIFTTYFALLPANDTVSIQLPYITWYGAFSIDSVIFPLVSSINIIESIECDDLNVWCVYTTKFGSQHRILMNATRLFLTDFLPILFALVYTLSIFMLFSLVVFLPVYLLIPVVSRASDVIVSSFGSTVKIIGTKDTVFAWLIFAVPFFTFVFALIFGYLNLFAPVFNSIKLALLYFLSFVLQNIFFIPVGKMLTTIIVINASLLTIFVLYLVYKLAVFFKIEIKIPGTS